MARSRAWVSGAGNERVTMVHTFDSHHVSDHWAIHNALGMSDLWSSRIIAPRERWCVSYSILRNDGARPLPKVRHPPETLRPWGSETMRVMSPIVETHYSSVTYARLPRGLLGLTSRASRRLQMPGCRASSGHRGKRRAVLRWSRARHRRPPTRARAAVHRILRGLPDTTEGEPWGPCLH